MNNYLTRIFLFNLEDVVQTVIFLQNNVVEIIMTD